MNYTDIPEKIKKKTYDKNIPAVENAIKNIVMTEVGSVPGNPEFGSNINKFLFRTLDPLVSALLQEEILTALQRWEPRVKVIKILINEDLDYNRIIVSLIFSIIYDPEETEHEYSFKINNSSN